LCLSSLDRVLYIAFRSLYLLAQPRDVSRTTDHSVNVYSLACISYMHCRCLSFTFLFYSSLCIFVFISLVHAHSITFVPFITSDNPSSISGTFFFQPLLGLDVLFKSGPPFCILITFTHPHLGRYTFLQFYKGFSILQSPVTYVLIPSTSHLDPKLPFISMSVLCNHRYL